MPRRLPVEVQHRSIVEHYVTSIHINSTLLDGVVARIHLIIVLEVDCLWFRIVLLPEQILVIAVRSADESDTVVMPD